MTQKFVIIFVREGRKRRIVLKAKKDIGNSRNTIIINDPFQRWMIIQKCLSWKLVIHCSVLYGQIRILDKMGKSTNHFIFICIQNEYHCTSFLLFLHLITLVLFLLIDNAKVIARSKYLSTEANWQKTLLKENVMTILLQSCVNIWVLWNCTLPTWFVLRNAHVYGLLTYLNRLTHKIGHHYCCLTKKWEKSG